MRWMPMVPDLRLNRQKQFHRDRPALRHSCAASLIRLRGYPAQLRKNIAKRDRLRVCGSQREIHPAIEIEEPIVSRVRTRLRSVGLKREAYPRLGFLDRIEDPRRE